MGQGQVVRDEYGEHWFLDMNSVTGQRLMLSLSPSGAMAIQRGTAGYAPHVLCVIAEQQSEGGFEQILA